MTREEAHRIMRDDLVDELCIVDGRYFIDIIYDDFESRTCESCFFSKRCQMEQSWISLSISNLECCDDWDKWSSQYGCNKWEKKDEI